MALHKPFLITLAIGASVVVAFQVHALDQSGTDRGIHPVTPVHRETVFTANRGQWPEHVLFRTTSGGASLWIMRDGLVYQFTRPARPSLA